VVPAANTAGDQSPHPRTESLLAQGCDTLTPSRPGRTPQDSGGHCAPASACTPRRIARGKQASLPARPLCPRVVLPGQQELLRGNRLQDVIDNRPGKAVRRHRLDLKRAGAPQIIDWPTARRILQSGGMLMMFARDQAALLAHAEQELASRIFLCGNRGSWNGRFWLWPILLIRPEQRAPLRAPF